MWNSHIGNMNLPEDYKDRCNVIIDYKPGLQHLIDHPTFGAAVLAIEEWEKGMKNPGEATEFILRAKAKLTSVTRHDDTVEICFQGRFIESMFKIACDEEDIYNE